MPARQVRDTTSPIIPPEQTAARVSAPGALHGSLRLVSGGARGVVLALAAVALLPYVFIPRYDLVVTRPFNGATLHSPYERTPGQWRLANFHAHSRAWSGLTSGRDSARAVYSAYRTLGYDVIGLSNYHTITTLPDAPNAIPVYEHGFGIQKTHQLVIGARRVLGWDIPIWQTQDAKQFLLSRLRDSAALTTIAHPYMRWGYTREQVRTLGAFDLLEVRSHWGDASAWWDAALTAGNPIWAVGDDDSHDVTRKTSLGLVWTVVDAPTTRPADIIAALRAGRMYVIAGQGARSDIHLISQSVRGDTMTTTFDSPARKIRVIGDSGRVVQTAANTATLRTVMPLSAHYVRLVASTDSNTLYLNPVLRASLPVTVRDAPPIRPLASFISRTVAGALFALAVVLLVPGRWSAGLRQMARRRLHIADAGKAASIAILAGALMAPPLPAQSTSRPFAPGERNEYELKFGILTVGTGVLSVAGPDTVRGHEVLRLRYRIDGGIPFFRVHDEMESWFDPVTMVSYRFTQELREGSKRYSRHFDFFPDERVVLERGKPSAASVASPLDDASFIFFMRMQPLVPGVILRSDRYFRPDANPIIIRVLRRETITVPAGTFATIVVQPQIKTAGIFSDGGEALLWFSDDASRTLIQMRAKLSFGSIGLYLKPRPAP